MLGTATKVADKQATTTAKAHARAGALLEIEQGRPHRPVHEVRTAGAGRGAGNAAGTAGEGSSVATPRPRTNAGSPTAPLTTKDPLDGRR